MSELDSLKSKPKAKRVLKGVHFDFEGSHVAYTDASQGGAASMMNEPFLLKSIDPNKPLNEEQTALLEKMGYKISDLEKSALENTSGLSSPESGDSAGGEPKETITKGKEDTMSEQDKDLQKQLADLQRELAVTKSAKTLTGYGLSDEETESLAGALVTLGDEKEAVIKALDALKAKVEVAETAKQEAEGKLEKAGGEVDNPLAKALDEEAGTDGEDTTVEKSFAERVAEKTELTYKEKGAK